MADSLAPATSAPAEVLPIDELFRMARQVTHDILSHDAFRAQLSQRLARPSDLSVEKCDRTCLLSLSTVIRHFVETESTGESARVLCNLIVSVVQTAAERSDLPLQGFGGLRTFDIVAELKRAYWNAALGTRLAPRSLHPPHRVIRINDIPFAESIFPALLANGSADLGYSIQVEDVPWSQVGAALYNGRIDVALSNHQILPQLVAVETLFDQKLIYRGAPMVTYRSYPVIARKDEARARGGDHNSASQRDKLIGVPEKSDFEDVATLNSNRRGAVKIPSGLLRRTAKVAYRASADEVLKAVVDGELDYGLVGGLQAHYAVSQFGKGTPTDLVKRVGYLPGPAEDAAAHFWVAVSRRDEADELLSIMHTLWNELVVRDWRRVDNNFADPMAQRLVDIVNSHKHRSFIDEFESLSELINRHDGRIVEVPRCDAEYIDPAEHIRRRQLALA